MTLVNDTRVKNEAESCCIHLATYQEESELKEDAAGFALYQRLVRRQDECCR
jgi:hypothetical protein